MQANAFVMAAGDDATKQAIAEAANALLSDRNGVSLMAAWVDVISRGLTESVVKLEDIQMLTPQILRESHVPAIIKVILCARANNRRLHLAIDEPVK